MTDPIEDAVRYALAQLAQAEADEQAAGSAAERFGPISRQMTWGSVLTGALICYLLNDRPGLGAEQAYEMTQQSPQRENLIATFAVAKDKR